MSTGPHESALCVLGCRSASGHPWPAAEGGYLCCYPCGDRLADVLAEILEKYPTLMEIDTLLYRDQHGGRPAKGFDSTPPASVHLLAMRDPRSVAEQPGDPHSPLNVVWWWATEVRRLRNTQPSAGLVGIADEAATLRFHWDWILRQAWLPNLAEDLRDVRRQLRHVLPGGDPARPSVGDCDRPTGAGAETQPCGQALYLPKAGKSITCSACGHVYDTDAMIKLHHRAQQRQAAS